MAPAAVPPSPGPRAAGSGGRRAPTAPTAAGDVPPNQTLYCNNLNDKLHKQDLQACLYEFFSAYGLVLEVVVRGTNMRGQAFVVFADLSSATAALRAAQGKDFLGKPLRVQYAKTKSDAVLKLNDQYKPRKPNVPRTKVDAGAGAAATKAKDGKATGETGQFSLFIENLPPKATKTSLDILFGQYRGHTESRLIEGRGVAFVDFSTQAQAAVAMQGMQGFKVDPSHPIKISMVEK
ncbi:hypothetical protein NCLIV_003960 [Neospora caninum Liverpool]|uniref:U1 small nuclear ribonucleoprotein A,related n=1 Tax=Neospora caninum (strain Liverpool) TaxID=572307 RepID=F0V871_NEOCL|nr:hypothetical protein NCLIV_003960 [Neospora caninum Liverpool]CBZ49912.1 hypothetical protein NCLIV_003960 [Neospora caninum Liverpool]CEL64499.1 TPA: U1 small nuclear ribonucleoprotein A,related [Neospora caninum Liverpool]|eukprot:XP_003879947.1 hypothetical protein NCLIV_003960 [Neospora caninum Liverpool]